MKKQIGGITPDHDLVLETISVYEHLTRNRYDAEKTDPMGNIPFFGGDIFFFEGDKYEPNSGSVFTFGEFTKRPIALDFMGTLNSPKAKALTWDAMQKALVEEQVDPLMESGFSADQVAEFQRYAKETGRKPMQLREYVVSPSRADAKEIKAALGNYVSIGAEAGQMDFCAVYDDAVDFMTIAKALGHPVTLFSTVRAPEGRKSLQEVMLEKYKLSPEYRLFLNAWGANAVTARDLVDNIVVGDTKKSDPGMAVYNETRARGLHAYVDDEREIVDATVATFGQNQGTSLPVLCRIERGGIKDAGYAAPKEHPNIGTVVVAKSLMDEGLLRVIYSI